MKEMNILPEEGQITYHINGKADVVFNPTDAKFARKLYNVFEQLEQKQTAYQEALKNAKDTAALFDVLDKLDAETRELIDGTLGEGLCAAVFGDMSIYALADGLPVWANLLLAIMDEIDESVAREIKLTNPRIEKYTKKYQKKYHK